MYLLKKVPSFRQTMLDTYNNLGSRQYDFQRTLQVNIYGIKPQKNM